MPSPLNIGPTEADWLAKLTEMQTAIAALNADIASESSYKQKLGFTDDDLSESGDDDDDLFEDDDDETDISSFDGHPYTPIPDAFDLSWLQSKCSEHAKKIGGELDAGQLSEKLVSILGSKDGEIEIQSSLTDILGYDDFDLIAELIAHRQELVAASKSALQLGGGSDGTLRLMTREQRERALQQADLKHKSKPLGPKLADPAVTYPHIYRTYNAGNTLSVFGKKYALPMGSKDMDHKEYQEITIPPNKVGTVAAGEKQISIAEMDHLCKQTFAGYRNLNRMQSLVYHVAYKTNENMLICAPTGAGKTDAAMLTILRTIALYTTPRPYDDPHATDLFTDLDAFKIIYVAPMKALAAEIVEKFQKRTKWLKVQVRELTGDMQMTKAEIKATQLIVTTPEKWDVVTRKSVGDTELVQKVKLLILDEVHMLHDERGAVIESIVARTERQVESTQSMIRIVGLSATLPNFKDVADFLKVNPYKGLFFFDSSFRPVPLEQHFVGAKGKPGSRLLSENLEKACFQKVKEVLEQGKQVMVFVHSRKDTIKTAKMLHQMAIDDDCLELFDNREHPAYLECKREMGRSKARELRDLYNQGLGVHHAGLLRTDRNLIERVFGKGPMNVLVCTATLAWGVNLPAAAVVIKGTRIYDAQKGGFQDLGILDVLQIFGRAGRPQFQEFGTGYICTTHDRLHHYLSAVTQQIPIESKLVEKVADNLNAEISLGTVTSVDEGIEWLSYSYLFVRWQRNPLAYGIPWDEMQDDPRLKERRKVLIVRTARKLHALQMIIYDERTGELSPKDIGRIASNFYISHTTIGMFNSKMKPHASEADILNWLSLSSEFENIQVRESDNKELRRLRDDYCQTDVPKPKSTPKVSGDHPKDKKGERVTIGGAVREQQQGEKIEEFLPNIKVNILLQAYVSRASIDDFALVSDMGYVAQNAGRICRAMFQIALGRRWGGLCLQLLAICKSIEKRVWPFFHPLCQMNLPPLITQKLLDMGRASSIETLRDMSAADIGALVNNPRLGPAILDAAMHFPTLSIDYEIAPMNRDVLRIRLFLTQDFRWNNQTHGNLESYWIWVENSDNNEIYHVEFFMLNRKQLHMEHELNFTIPLSDPLPSQLYVRCTSDRWLGTETVTPISFQHLIRPDTEPVFTDLLNLQPLPISALKNPTLEQIYAQKFKFFNAMQTQIFHTLYHTPANVLLGSPTGSGKTIACELAMWWAFREKPKSKVVYIAPMKALVRERVRDWNARVTGPMGLKLVELTGDNTPDTRAIQDADIIITTPEKWDGISRSWQTRSYVRKVSLIIIDEIHLLGGDRGPILEIIVSRMNYVASQSESTIRIMGMSTACANADDLANWLGVKEGQGLYNFRHSVRPVPLQTFIDGFPERQGFCPLMQSMNRPAFLAIKAHSPNKPVIIFVASRRQTRLTARDLINFCGMEDNPRRFLNMPDEDLQQLAVTIKEESLRESLQFGIGLHHAGLVESDRQAVEELFESSRIQVLVATSTLAWGVNLPAHLVIVKGTQFYDAKVEGYRDMDLTDVLQMLGRAGRPQFDTSGIAKIYTQASKKEFYKYFLHKGFPVESSLHKVLDDHLGAEISAGTIQTKQDALDYLTWTFFFRRLHKNPTYYGLQIPAEEQDSIQAQEAANDFLINLVEDAVKDLEVSGCAIIHSNGDVEPTPLGKIASYYYLSHKTVRSIVRCAKRGALFEEVLKWVSLAKEYDELPVRHNEDLLNITLANNLPLSADSFGLPMWDPHVKAFLLLQAFMTRADLPITDYITDQNTVLDQTVRIIQASVDILSEMSYLSSVKMLITLMQSIKQAIWPTDGPLAQIPGVDAERERQRSEQPNASPRSINELADLPLHQLEGIARRLNVSNFNQFHRIVTMSVPKIELEISTASASCIEGTISRLNPHPTPSTYRISAPKFPKPQTEGWFIIVGNIAKDDVYAIKRVGWPNSGSGSKRTAKISINLPSGLEGMNVSVWAVSDAYIGLEQRLEVHL